VKSVSPFSIVAGNPAIAIGEALKTMGPKVKKGNQNRNVS